MSGFTLLCDESGAKGSARQAEARRGEVGVFAGIIVDERVMPTVTADLVAIRARYQQADGAKFHITDLGKVDREKLRDEVFACLERHDLPCVYEAIHVQGFSDAFQAQETAVDVLATTRESDVKPSGRGGRAAPTLHHALFEGLFATTLGLCQEIAGSEFLLLVLTDHIDEPILAEFRECAAELVSFGGTTMIKQTGYDPATKQVVSGGVKMTIVIPEDLDVECLKKATYRIEVTDPSNDLTFAADILANSLAHHFHKRTGRDLGAPLHTSFALAGHPLASRLRQGIPVAGPHVSDLMYAHPDERARRSSL